MKTLQYKIAFIGILIFGTLNAQTFDKKYTQEFKTSDKVVIDVNTRHTDIEIETWNKNKVLIEATIEIEGATKERADEIIKNWKFNALGNTDEIEITSKTNLLFGERIIDVNKDVLSNLNNHDIDFVFPEVSIGNLAILDSLHVVLPDVLHFSELIVIPEVEDFNFSFDSMPFDYEKYKNDKNYLKEWQKQMKEGLEKMKIVMKENSVKIKENSARLKGELKIAQEERKKALKEYAEHRKKVAKLTQERLKERAVLRKEIVKERKEIQERRKEELTKRRVEIKNILIDRDKVKIKRVIKIKAPQDAKFNMNVSYGSMSFPN